MDGGKGRGLRGEKGVEGGFGGGGDFGVAFQVCGEEGSRFVGEVVCDEGGS